MFSILFFWFLYAVVDARLIFQARDKLFLLNLYYFTDFIGEPGLLLEWTDSLLVQLCYAGWPGALFFSVILWSLLASTNHFMNKVAGGRSVATWIIPGVVLMGLYADYYTHSSILVGTALTMTASNGWIHAGKWPGVIRFLLFSALALALYSVAGGFALTCFSACCLISEILIERKLRIAGGMLLVAVLIQFGIDAALRIFDPATDHFLLPAKEEFLQTKTGIQPTVFLYAYFPVCAGIVAAVRLFVPRFFKSMSTGKKGLIIHGALGVAALVAALGTGLHALNRETKTLLLVDYCAEHRLWKEVLDNAAKLSVEAYDQSCYANHNVNRALYYRGQLPSQMLSFRQSSLWLLPDYHSLRGEYHLIRIPCDFCIDVGRVNEAEHLALEMVEKWPSGAALKRMAWIKMIKNQPEAAKVYLNNLTDDLVWRKWARNYLQRLAQDPSLSNDFEIQEIRELMMDEDDLIKTVTFPNLGEPSINFSAGLRSQLEHNNRNRIAFEYLMAQYLLAGSLGGVASLFPLLDQFPYTNTPLYEEAILIFGIAQPDAMKVTPSGEVYFGNHQINPRTIERFMRLKTIVTRCGGFNSQAAALTAREFPGSYFEFYIRLQAGGARE
ncbi:MAG: hypothetical protein JXR23_07170 [Pontiellaceae bacterium]|nr:hypothetical protein [Pontiellaceae bacterium]